MNIIFRTDANSKIGMGHIMRCLSLADAFRNVNSTVQFILADDEVSSIINERGYNTIILNSDFLNMESELDKLEIRDNDYFIIDSYCITAYYLSTLKKKVNAVGGRLVYIDDVFAFPYPVDILVDYNIYATEDIYCDLYKGAEDYRPEFILGPMYVPLRGMFRGITKREQTREIHNVLISTGGSDELHLSCAILRYLLNGKKKQNKTIVYNFLIGSMNTDKEEIKQLSDYAENIILHENVSDMKSLICGMDIAISAAGSTLYEIAACGVPLITYSMADNQILGAEAFESANLAINVGDLRKPDSIVISSDGREVIGRDAVERIFSALEQLYLDKNKREKMASSMQELIDGYGADRVVERILASS